MYGLLANLTPIFAQTFNASEGTDKVFSQPLFITLAATGAVIVVIVGIFNTAKAIFQGRAAGAFKSVIVTIFVAGLLLNLRNLGTLLDGVANIVQALFDMIGSF